MGMFDFLDMMGNYEERKVAHDEKDDWVVDTAAVSDSDEPFETGITHPRYNGGDWVIVGLYSTKEKAIVGHKKWIKKMSGKLPKQLVDVSTCDAAVLLTELEGKQIYKKGS